jgi:signal transduction histidine kinase
MSAANEDASIRRLRGLGSALTSSPDPRAILDSFLEDARGIAPPLGTQQAPSPSRGDLERALRGLEASRDIATAIGTETSIERVLELIANHARALIDAQSMLIMLRDDGDLVVVAAAGHAADVHGLRLPVADSTSGHVLEQGRSERIADVGSRLQISAAELGVPEAHTGLLIPMLHRGEALGVLAAFDDGAANHAFTQDDEDLLSTFAATAATAVAMAQSVETKRLRSAIAAADAERGRWARDLHDQTLQTLGGLRVMLASALRRTDPAGNEEAMRQAIEDVEGEIGNLRAIISDLRPSILDDFGLLPALEALLERRRQDGLEIVSDLAVADPEHGGSGLDPQVETTVYRLVQEALTNVARHADARSVHVAVAVEAVEVRIEVEDDGVGFNVETAAPGFGVQGMRERVYLAGGDFTIDSGDSGTKLRVVLSTPQVPQPARASSADQ